MTHCRYCNRFRLVCVAGCGAWRLECGHTYLPLPTEGRRWAAYAGDGVSGLTRSTALS
jgi:hypothetical protein